MKDFLRPPSTTANTAKPSPIWTNYRDALLAFYDFSVEHWRHIRTTNPTESVFAAVRRRTVRTEVTAYDLTGQL